jgi:RNA polymerase sigma-70 factor (ECF subfamily)
VGRFLSEWPLEAPRRWRILPTRANSQIAFGTYMWSEARGVFEGHAIDVLTLDGSRIAAIDAFVEPALLERFGLPLQLAE